MQDLLRIAPRERLRNNPTRRQAVHLLVFVVIAAGGCSAPQLTDYKGPDAGMLVVSMGSIGHGPGWYRINYRKLGSGMTAALSVQTGADIFGDADYTGDAKGFVLVQQLPPGRYEIFGTEAGQNPDVISDAPMSLAFTILPGKATYIGRYDGLMLQMHLHSFWRGDYQGLGGVTFMVSDQHAFDIAVARSRVPALPDVTIALPDLTNVPSRYFRTR